METHGRLLSGSFQMETHGRVRVQDMTHTLTLTQVDGTALM